MSMKKVRRTRAEAMAETRRQLLDAAWAVFARCGFDGTSVQQIAQEAGYTTGAIYAHFASKETLFLALLRERYATKIGDLAALFERGTAQDQQRALADRFGSLRRIEGDWDLLATEFTLYASRHPEAAEPLREAQRRLRDGLAAIITHQLDALGISPATEPSLIAAAVVALGDGLGAQQRLNPDLFPNELFAATAQHLVLALATNPLPQEERPAKPPKGPRRP